MAHLATFALLALCVVACLAARPETQPPEVTTARPTVVPTAPMAPTGHPTGVPSTPEATTSAPETTVHPTTPGGECNAGDKVGDKEDCHKYKECDKSRKWVQKSCFWFRKYDTDAKKCMFWGAHCAQ